MGCRKKAEEAGRLFINRAVNRLINRFSTGKKEYMLISQTSTTELRRSLHTAEESFCSGLFLSARWFVLSAIAEKNLHLVILPTREAAADVIKYSLPS